MKPKILVEFWNLTERNLLKSTANRALLQTRFLANEEPKLQPNGSHWLTTRGVEITEDGKGLWRFTITALPPEAKRPAMVELPLVDDFIYPDAGMMKMQYRLIDSRPSDIKTGQYFELYFRTANGNLYQVWPRQYATANWQRYTEVKENYTMAFYGRANLPWRFRDNRPVSLVFFFRPNRLPATFEIKNAQIVKLESRGPQ